MTDLRDDAGSPSSRLLAASNTSTTPAAADNNNNNNNNNNLSAGNCIKHDKNLKEGQVSISLVNYDQLNSSSGNNNTDSDNHTKLGFRKAAGRSRRLKLPLRMMRKLNMLGAKSGHQVYSNGTGVGPAGTGNGNASSQNPGRDLAKALSELADEADDGLQVVRVNREESNLAVGLKLFAIFSTIYFFMWSSSILSQAFNLASYHYAGNFIRTSGFLQNPLIGLMVGVITTVVFQSSGAVTSVLVTIVGSGVLTVRQSIPIIMGANLGTSVTNTIVSLIVYRTKSNFEIAMTAGIVHDMYNMLSVVFMLPIELLLHPLESGSIWLLGLFARATSDHLSASGGEQSSSQSSLQFLGYLVRPLVDLVIMIDTDLTNKLEPNIIVPSDVSLVKRCCNSERRGNETICHERCLSLFSRFELSDSVVCILLSVIAMATLFTCLVFVVKVTKSLLGGKLLNWVARLARKDYRYPYKYFVGYLFILVGLVITAVLHSSGVFTSMLVPLAGGDVLNLMQIYELTLGSNVGTTTTGILAALSAQSKYPLETLQVALCHFLFNLAGILMFYAFPHTKLPIWASKRFGMLSARNMWFSIGYLVVVFLLAPALTMLIYFATTG